MYSLEILDELHAPFFYSSDTPDRRADSPPVNDECLCERGPSRSSGLDT
jgi:hypothetical protein